MDIEGTASESEEVGIEDVSAEEPSSEAEEGEEVIEEGESFFEPGDESAGHPAKESEERTEV